MFRKKPRFRDGPAGAERISRIWRNGRGREKKRRETRSAGNGTARCPGWRNRIPEAGFLLTRKKITTGGGLAALRGGFCMVKIAKTLCFCSPACTPTFSGNRASGVHILAGGGSDRFDKSNGPIGRQPPGPSHLPLPVKGTSVSAVNHLRRTAGRGAGEARLFLMV